MFNQKLVDCQAFNALFENGLVLIFFGHHRGIQEGENQRRALTVGGVTTGNGIDHRQHLGPKLGIGGNVNLHKITVDSGRIVCFGKLAQARKILGVARGIIAHAGIAEQHAPLVEQAAPEREGGAIGELSNQGHRIATTRIKGIF